MQHFFFATLIAFILGFAPESGAQDKHHGTPAQAQAMVARAIDFYKKHGRDQALDEITNPTGRFVDGDLYVSVFDLNGNVLAHGNHPASAKRMRGKNLMDMRDVEGRYFIKERIEIAKGPGKGWHDYKYFNPATSTIEAKSAWVVRHDDLVFACGIYKY